MLDLSKIDVLDECVVELLHPIKGTPVGASVTLLGPDHPVRRKISTARQTKIRNELKRTGKIQFGDPETDLQDEIAELADCVIGWTGIAEEGNEVKYTKENAQRIFANVRWLREQVSAELNNKENFIKDL